MDYAQRRIVYSHIHKAKRVRARDTEIIIINLNKRYCVSA